MVRYDAYIRWRAEARPEQLVFFDEGHFVARWVVLMCLLIFDRDLRRIYAVAPIGVTPSLQDSVRLGHSFSLTVGICLNGDTPIACDYREGSNTAQDFLRFLVHCCEIGFVKAGQVSIQLRYTL